MAGAALTETSTFSASVVAPLDSDKVTGASVTVGEQALANRTRALYDGKFASVTVDRVVNELWSVSDVTNVIQVVNQVPSVPVGSYALLPLRFPHGSTINSITVGVDPGAHASMPQFMPSLVMFRINAATGVVDNSGGGPWGLADPSANVTTYNPAHDVTFNVGITVDRTQFIYVLRFLQESGSNSTAGSIFPARVNVTTALQDPAGIV